MSGRRRRLPVAGLDPVPWTAPEALLAIAGAHLALLVGGVVVMGAGGWDVGAQPIGADVAALVPFWAVALVLSFRLADRGPLGPGAELGLTGVRPTTPRRRAIEVGAGALAGVVTSLAVVPLLYVVVHRLAGTTAADLERPARLLADRADTGLGVALLVLSTCVAAPLVEETLYRGVLLPALGSLGTTSAVVASAVVFAAAHLQLLQFPGLVAIGLVLGVLRVVTGALVAPVAAHVGFNVTAVVVLLTQS